MATSATVVLRLHVAVRSLSSCASGGVTQWRKSSTCRLMTSLHLQQPVCRKMTAGMPQRGLSSNTQRQQQPVMATTTTTQALLPLLQLLPPRQEQQALQMPSTWQQLLVLCWVQH